MMNAMTHEQVLAALRAANVVAQRSLQQGHHPFGAVLIGPQGDRVWLEQGNVDTVNQPCWRGPLRRAGMPPRCGPAHWSAP